MPSCQKLDLIHGAWTPSEEKALTSFRADTHFRDDIPSLVDFLALLRRQWSSRSNLAQERTYLVTKSTAL